jgi:hypothetical protein
MKRLALTIRRFAPPGRAGGIPARIRTARSNRPTKSGHARLPRVPRKRSPLQASDTGVEAAVFSAVDAIKRFRHFAASVLGYEVGERGRIQAASRHAETLAERFGGLKQIIRDR